MNDCYNTMVSDRDGAKQKFLSRGASTSTPMNSSRDNEDAFLDHTRLLRGRRTAPIAFSVPLNMNQEAESSFGSKLDNQCSRAPIVLAEEMRRSQSQHNNNEGNNEVLLRSGPLEVSSYPDCVPCPAAYKTNQPSNEENVTQLEKKLYNILFGGNKGCARKVVTFLNSHLPIMNPHTKIVQQWNKFFAISCLVAIFIDPLFFFLLNADRVKLHFSMHLVKDIFIL